MNINLKALERKQFLKYFKAWIIIAAVLLVIWGVLALLHKPETAPQRGNNQAPAQRVYDYADVLSDSEEEYLRQVIAECEQQGLSDIVLVTICEEMGRSDSEWNRNMMNCADDFYDNGKFGFDKPYGDGALLLDNWYEDEYGSQMGTWLSTSGKMEDRIGVSEEDSVLDAIYDYIDYSTVKAYEAGIRKLAYWGNRASGGIDLQIPVVFILVIPSVVAFIFAVTSMKQAPGTDTTTAYTYLAGGKPNLRRQSDVFERKHVTSVKIESSSGSGGGHHGGGSAGHHHSSGGHSHGGGGRRR